MKIEHTFNGIHSDIQINSSNKKINLECKISFIKPPLIHCRSLSYIVRLNIKNINKPNHKVNLEKMCYVYLEGIKLPVKMNYKKIQDKVYEVVEPCTIVDKKIIKNCFGFVSSLKNDNFIYHHILKYICKCSQLKSQELKVVADVCMGKYKCGK